MNARATVSAWLRASLHEAIPLLSAVAMAILWTFWPMFSRLSTHSIAERDGLNDSLQNVWQLWWAQTALSSGRQPFFSELLYYPEGVPLFWQTLNITNGVLGTPITAFFGPLVALNVLFMLSFLLTASSAYLLLRQLQVTVPTATVGAVMYAFSPFHLQSVVDGQLEIASIQYFPVMTLVLMRLLAQPRVGYLLAGSVTLALAALTSHYFGLFLCIYSGLFLAATLIVRRPGLREALWRVVSVSLMLLPTLVMYFLQLDSLTDVINPASASLRITGRSLDLFDLVLPSPFHPLWGDPIAALQSALHPDLSMINVSLGVLPWLLAGYAVYRRWHTDGRLHLLVIVLMIILAMGPSLRIGGDDTGLKLPYALLLEIPGFSAGQRPNHLMLPAAVHVLVLAAYGLDLLRTMQPRRSGVSILVLTLLAVDLLPRPFAGTPLPDQSAYARIGPGSGAVLDIPPQFENSGPMMGQIVHGRPILGGYLARRLAFPFEQVPGIGQLMLDERYQPSVVDTTFPADLTTAAARHQISHVVFAINELTPGMRARLAEMLTFCNVIYRDADAVVVELPHAEASGLSVAVGNGWYPLEASGHQWTTERADIHLFRTSVNQHSARLTVTVNGQTQAQTVRVAAAGGLTQSFAVGAGSRRYRILVPLAAERTDVTMMTDARTIGTDPRALGLSISGLQAAVTAAGD